MEMIFKFHFSDPVEAGLCQKESANGGMTCRIKNTRAWWQLGFFFMLFKKIFLLFMLTLDKNITIIN